MKQLWRRWLLLVLAALPAVVPLLMILNYGVDTPFSDELDEDFAGIYVKAHQHQLSFADLIAPHNEHRDLVPKLALLMIAWVSNGNYVFAMVCGWLVVCLTSIGILWLHHMNIRESPQGTARYRVPVFLRFDSIFLWFLANLLIFSTRQSEIWLWGLGIVNAMPMLFVVAAILVARSSLGIRVRTALVILLSTAATYCVVSGAASWVLAGAVLLWSANPGELKSKVWVAAALAGALLINIGLYLVGLFETALAPAGAYTFSITRLIRYLVLYFGSLYVHSATFPIDITAGFVGTVMLLLLIGCIGWFLFLWRKRRQMSRCLQMLAWFAVAGYAVLGGLMTGLGRAGMVAETPYTPRYVAFSLYLPAALIYLLWMVGNDLREMYRLRQPGAANSLELPAGMRAFGFLQTALITLMIFGWVMELRQELYIARVQNRDRRLGRAALTFVKVLPNNPLIAMYAHPDLSMVKQVAPGLNDVGYLHPPLIESGNVALLKPAVIADGAFAGAIERIWTPTDTELSMYGWAIFPRLRRSADAILICYNNEQGEPMLFSMAPLGMTRADRARALNDDAYDTCGWAAEFPMSKFPPMPKTLIISVWAYNSEFRTAYQLEGTATLNR